VPKTVTETKDFGIVFSAPAPCDETQSFSIVFNAPASCDETQSFSIVFSTAEILYFPGYLRVFAW
jgi:hypothetical protein